MKVSYYSLGCKVNLYESEAIVNQFLDHGFTLSAFHDVCDVYIVNTCTVTQTSDAKSRKMIRQAIKRNADAIVCVMGCYAQTHLEEIKEILGVDVVVGTHNRSLLFPLALEALEQKRPNISISDIQEVKEYEELKIKRFNNKTRGFVKIEDGCNNYCTYCAIPYARGPVRSRQKQDVIEEIQILTDQGMKEIVLTGINTAAYGLDFEAYTFADLLRDIVKEVSNLGRVRISSIEVTEISDELLAIIGENKEKFCNHFHIPLQSGSANVLKKMARKYDLTFYKEKIDKIRAIFPDVNITTDMMVGFSGETESDFKEVLEFIDLIQFGEMHIFPYSKRPGTKAFHYKEEVNDISKKVRVNTALQKAKEMALDYRKQFIDSVVEVVVEKVEGQKAYGHSSNYLQVTFPAFGAKQNDLVKVKVTKAAYPISQGERL